MPHVASQQEDWLCKIQSLPLHIHPDLKHFLYIWVPSFSSSIRTWIYFCSQVAKKILRFLSMFYCVVAHSARHSSSLKFQVSFGQFNTRHSPLSLFGNLVEDTCNFSCLVNWNRFLNISRFYLLFSIYCEKKVLIVNKISTIYMLLKCPNHSYLPAFKSQLAFTISPKKLQPD